MVNFVLNNKYLNSIYSMVIRKAIILRGLGIGDWGLGPIPNPQSPIPNIFSIIKLCL